MTNTTKTPKPNKFAGPCATCEKTVPAGEGILAGRMVGGSRRWLIRHNTGECTPPAAMPVNRPPKVNRTATSAGRRTYLRVDENFIAWIGKMIIEEGSIEAARAAYAAAHEFWDGEDSARIYDEARFDAALVPALEQNKAIHGTTRCAECDRPGPRASDCILCQHDSGLDGDFDY